MIFPERPQRSRHGQEKQAGQAKRSDDPMLAEERAGARAGQNNGQDRQVARAGQHGQPGPQVTGDGLALWAGRSWQLFLPGDLGPQRGQLRFQAREHLLPLFDVLAQLVQPGRRFTGIRRVQRPA